MKFGDFNMNEDILKFSDFLDFYKQDYRKTSHEISMPKPTDSGWYEEGEELAPLVESDFLMLDFDSMCDDANFYPKRPKKFLNEPSTVDALYYRIVAEDKMEFFLVEFKSFYFDWNSTGDYNSSVDKIFRNLIYCNINDDLITGINRLNSIKNIFGSTIEFSLRLKPYESLFVVLPKIYEEYCGIKNIPFDDRIDLYDFFKSELCDIKLIVVGKKTDNAPKDYLGVLGNILDKQYRRLDFVNVLIHHKDRLCLNDDFDKLTVILKKYEPNTIKSLNYGGNLCK